MANKAHSDEKTITKTIKQTLDNIQNKKELAETGDEEDADTRTNNDTRSD